MLISILELLAEQYSDLPPTHKITEKIQSEFKRIYGYENKKPLTLGSSVSRDTGNMSDIRTVPLSYNTETMHLKHILNLFAQQKLLDVEVKVNEDSQEVTLIVTKVAYPEILESALAWSEGETIETESKVLRTGNHGANIKYYNGNTMCFASSKNNLISSQAEFNEMKQKTDSSAEGIAIFDFYYGHTEEELSSVMEKLKKFFNLTSEQEIIFYKNSSHPTCPLDLRFSINIDNPNLISFQKKLEGLTALNAVMSEVKTEALIKTFIIKRIDMARINTYLNRKDIGEATPEELQRVISILQKQFPASRVIADLIVFDGKKLSATRPYFHIRSKEFYPANDFFIIEKNLRPLSDDGAFQLHARPLVDEEQQKQRDKYTRFRKFEDIAEQHQLIIDHINEVALKQAISNKSERQYLVTELNHFN